jgi:hypothetical protein
LVLVLLEVCAYVLALVTLIFALILVSVATPLLSFVVPGTSLGIIPADQFGIFITLVQVTLFLVAVLLAVLGRFIRASRKRRALVQQLCDAVLKEVR